jgi:hypothetical protein
MDEEVADTESLAIFVLDSKKIKADGVTWRAFMPNEVDGERSLFRVDDLETLDIIELGQREVGDAQTPPRVIKGWAQFIAREVRTRPPLQLVAAEPPPRHGVIRNWPVDWEQKQKLALDLAGVASTHRCP